MTGVQTCALDRKSTRLNSSHTIISYAVFCLKKKVPDTWAAPPPRRRARVVAAAPSAPARARWGRWGRPPPAADTGRPLLLAQRFFLNGGGPTVTPPFPPHDRFPF